MDEALESLKKMAAEQAEQNKKNRMACENCGWFAVRGDEKIGECHRYPPTFDMPEGEEWKHASVSRDNVCGEFVHRRTGASFQADPYRAMTVRVARLEEEIDRLRRVAAE
jgi:hypothetical protein